MCGSGQEIAEFRVEDILQQLSDCPGDTVHLEKLLVQRGKCQQCLVKEGLTWRLSCWRDEVQELQVQEANVAIDYRNASRYKKLLGWQAVLEKYVCVWTCQKVVVCACGQSE